MKIYLLHNIGNLDNKNYNTIDEIRAADGLLTFDGVYENVWMNRDILKDRKTIIFIMGNYIGGDNSFDAKMPRERLCDWNKIMDLVYMGAELGWHTWSHKDLRKLSDEEVLKEITPPFPMKYFAYPYGLVDKRVEKIVNNYGYKLAFCAGKYGNDTRLQLKREYL